MQLKRVENEELQILSLSAAARLTGFSRDVLRREMNLYQKSRGRLGLPFVVLSVDRRIRKSSLRNWLEKHERSAIYA